MYIYIIKLHNILYKGCLTQLGLILAIACKLLVLTYSTVFGIGTYQSVLRLHVFTIAIVVNDYHSICNIKVVKQYPA